MLMVMTVSRQTLNRYIPRYLDTNLVLETFFCTRYKHLYNPVSISLVVEFYESFTGST